MKRLERSLPYFQAIIKSPSRFRWELLHSMPEFVMQDFFEVLQNILEGRVDIGTKKWVLRKYRKVLIDFANEGSLSGKKRILLEHLPLKPRSPITVLTNKDSKKKYLGAKQGIQSGGAFIAAAIPIVVSILKALGIGAASGLGIAGATAIVDKITDKQKQ